MNHLAGPQGAEALGRNTGGFQGVGKRDQHMNPAEAVQAFVDCGAEAALAHHYGTFQLTDEAIDAPVVALAEALMAAGIPAGLFRALRPGEVVQL